jgi:hypothetical protein
MPRYYFPSWDGDSFVPDEVGVDVGGFEEARALATLALAEMARDTLPGSSSERVLRMLVMDGEDKPVLELRLTFEIVRDT